MKQVKIESPGTKLESFLKEDGQFLEQVGRHIVTAGNKLEPTWSGSWAGYHANLYFKEYQVPTTAQMFDSEWGGAGIFNGGYDPGWQTKSLDEVWAHIIGRSPVEFELDKVDDKLRRLQELMEEFKLELELATDNDVLLKKIKDVDTSFSMGTYVKVRTPGQIVSRDSKAIYQGMKVPPHIQCLGFGHAIEHNLQAAKELLKLVGMTQKLAKEKPRKRSSNQAHDYWHYTNPFWLIGKASVIAYRFVINNKVKAAFGLLVTLATFLAIDYNLAWTNTQALLRLIGLH